MAKQQKYPEVYLGIPRSGHPEIDFMMLGKSQGIEGRKVTEPKELEAALRRGADADSTWHQRFKLRR